MNLRRTLDALPSTYHDRHLHGAATLLSAAAVLGCEMRKLTVGLCSKCSHSAYLCIRQGRRSDGYGGCLEIKRTRERTTMTDMKAARNSGNYSTPESSTARDETIIPDYERATLIAGVIICVSFGVMFVLAALGVV